ncbi:hypothetical protein IMZ48_18545 [Candidatus Bathyarchaeota archaeon]|nr:hypothetical protein [Candidatus Bathyarchaeota archaeon]
MTVGECLGDAAGNWYRTSRDGGGDGGGGEDPGSETPDGTCGGANGYTCPSESYRCCSKWGYCGDSDEHCGSGCSPDFGICW